MAILEQGKHGWRTTARMKLSSFLCSGFHAVRHDRGDFEEEGQRERVNGTQSGTDEIPWSEVKQLVIAVGAEHDSATC